MGKETQEGEGEEICPRSQGKEMAKAGIHPGSLAPGSGHLTTV